LGAPIAWSLHLMSSYLLATVACSMGWAAIGPAFLMTTGFFALMSASAGLVAYREWQAIRTTGASSEADSAHDRTAFLMVVGMALATLFLLIVLLGGLIPLFVPYCP
jgi:cytochrome c biogenesis factor